MDQDADMLEFDELAQKLSDRYTAGYGDRDQAMREFGFEHETVLRHYIEDGRSLLELAEKARMSLPVEYYMRLVSEGMGAALYIRNSERF